MRVATNYTYDGTEIDPESGHPFAGLILEFEVSADYSPGEEPSRYSPGEGPVIEDYKIWLKSGEEIPGSKIYCESYFLRLLDSEEGLIEKLDEAIVKAFREYSY